MSHKFEGTISSIHITRPFTEDELIKINRPLSLAIWFCSECGSVIDEKIETLDDETENGAWTEMSGSF